MSFLHQTQPTIQLLLTSSEFSGACNVSLTQMEAKKFHLIILGALDLITTSCEILSVDLHGIRSFRHLASQLKEIQAIIGKMLLNDFQTFISAEIGRETVHVKATTLCASNRQWQDLDTDQLKSVIFGLLRQNSFTFLEALEDASTSAIKATMREVVVNITKPAAAAAENGETTTTVTSLVQVRITSEALKKLLTNVTSMQDFAKSAMTEEWIDLFDVLVGSLIVLLYRIHTVHKVRAQFSD